MGKMLGFGVETIRSFVNAAVDEALETLEKLDELETLETDKDDSELLDTALD